MDYSKALRKLISKSDNRKIVLISQGVLGNYLLKTFKELNVDVEYYIDIKRFKEKEKNFHLPDKLCYRQGEYFIIVAIYSGHKEVVEELAEKGYQYYKDCTVSTATVYVDELDMADPLLGINRQNEKYPGIVCMGEPKKSSLSILILGNSTTDGSMGNVHSWVHYFFRELEETNKNVVIYNGAIAGYNSGQEFLKLCRDGLSLKPDMVISFGGVTDVKGVGTVAEGRKLLHKFQWRMWRNIIECPGAIPDTLHIRGLKKLSTGIETDKSNGELWVENQRKMKAVCSEFGIKFIGCLQPMIVEGCIVEEELNLLLEDMGKDENFYGAQRKFIDQVRENTQGLEYIKDLTGVFEGRDKMYNDEVHYTEPGNQIIGKVIADMVMSEINNGF